MKLVKSRSRAAVRLIVVAVLGILSACSPATTAPSQADPQPTVTAPPATATAATSPLPTATIESPLPTPTEPATPTAEATTVPSSTPEEAGPAPTEWRADGVIEVGEYNREADFGDMRLWWRNDDTYLYIAIEGDTTGWVSIGIDPDTGMQGANYLFGYVTEDEALLWDAYGTAPRGANHPPDVDLGGTDDIIAFAGVEEDGVTRFEIQIPLDSGDPYDKVLLPGQTYPVIVAIGAQDAFNDYHLRYDYGELVLD